MDLQKLSPEILENQAYRNIITRTSVRLFDSKPVSAEMQSAILHAAMCAPTGVNRQPWDFILVDNPEILKSLADNLPYAKMAAKAPMAVVACANPERFLEGEDATLWIQDLAAASENILLAANALGLGAVWTCLYPHADRVEAVRKILTIPENIIPFSLIPVGYPLKPHKPMDKWHPERISHNRFSPEK